MSETDNGQIVAVAVTTHVKLCPYHEEEPAIWFHLVAAQFAAAGIKLQKLRYTNTLPVKTRQRKTNGAQRKTKKS
jgi:hypothetical protein